MPKVNLELQMKFLSELDEALKEALGRYADDGAEKLAELEYMKSEVTRARRIIASRMKGEGRVSRPKRQSAIQADIYREAAFS